MPESASCLPHTDRHSSLVHQILLAFPTCVHFSAATNNDTHFSSNLRFCTLNALLIDFLPITITLVQPLDDTPSQLHCHTFTSARRSCMAMTRRHTISSGSEMDLLTSGDDPLEPLTPPPVWTPALPQNKYAWRKPSKWQICMPRLRAVTKVVAAFILSIFFFQFLFRNPLDHALPPPTEGQLREAAAQENWAWRDFPQYDCCPSFTQSTVSG
jgi:ABC-type Fe3+-siderophore transport system permease subunit